MKLERIKELAESVINKLNSELLQSLDNAKLAEGAIKGIKILFDEIIKDEQHNQLSRQEEATGAE